MELIEKRENQITVLAEVEEPLMNSIRRYVNQVSTLAVDEVEISRNDSPLYDETIAHRIGLVPLKMGKVNAKNLQEAKISVSREGYVYSKDLKGVDVVYGDMPLTFLNKGQEIEINAKTTMGKGAEHSKFSPGFIFYRNASEIIADKTMGKELQEVCRKNSSKEKNDKVIISDNLRKGIADFCEGIAKKHGKTIEISPSNELVITIESFGQMPEKEIFKKAIEGLKKDLEEVSKKI